jgi:hypothetical protein
MAVSVGVGRGRVVGAAALGRRFGGGDLERDRDRERTVTGIAEEEVHLGGCGDREEGNRCTRRRGRGRVADRVYETVSVWCKSINTQ